MTQARVLIVEDGIIVANNLKDRLEELGYEVPAIVVSGEGAVQQVAEARPDVVLMDIKLQGQMNGIEAAEQIRTRFDVPVVYLTGYADDRTLAQAKVTEPFGFLLKPFDVRELRSTVEMAIYKHAMDRKLRESERRYRQLVETLQEGIWTIDKDGCTTYVNPRMAEMLGYTAAEMQGRHLFSFMDQDGVELAQRYLERRAQGIQEQHEFVFLHKEGWQVYTLMETAPLTDEAGNHAGAIAGVTDITDRVRTERQLRLQGAALEAAANAIVITDMEGIILWANPAFARLTGYAAEEAIGQNSRLLKSNFHDPAFYQQMWDTILTGQVWHGEIVNRRKDGNLYTEELTITPIADRDGQITHFVAIKQDITKRKWAEQELWQAKEIAEAANRAKSTFLSNMGHEFRTPLNAIIGYSEILQEEVADLELHNMLPDLARIRQAGQHLLTLISDVLDVSKIETGRMELHLETFDVQTMIGDVIWAATPLVEDQHNLLTIECRDSVGRMQADRDKVRQILVNLLSNAAKFTHEGQITLIAERRTINGSDSLFFRVIDTGIGITPERIADLFEPFTQMDPSVTRKYGGTGLGLALCQRLCALMGGGISVESEPGRGSTFSVRLPAIVRQAQLPSMQPARPGCEENSTCPTGHHQRQ